MRFMPELILERLGMFKQRFVFVVVVVLMFSIKFFQ